MDNVRILKFNVWLSFNIMYKRVDTWGCKCTSCPIRPNNRASKKMFLKKKMFNLDILLLLTLFLITRSHSFCSGLSCWFRIKLWGYLITFVCLFFSHVFIGFSADGKYLYSYQCKLRLNALVEPPAYCYTLHWWLFDLWKPLKMVSAIMLRQSIADDWSKLEIKSLCRTFSGWAEKLIKAPQQCHFISLWCLIVLEIFSHSAEKKVFY